MVPPRADSGGIGVDEEDLARFSSGQEDAGIIHYIDAPKVWLCL